MKNVLLTTTALVAFAGAASAVEVALDWSGSAFVEYDVDGADFDAGLTANLDITLSQELNNGMVASLYLPASLEIDETGFDTTEWETNNMDWIAKLETSYGSLSFGSIDNAIYGLRLFSRWPAPYDRIILNKQNRMICNEAGLFFLDQRDGRTR